MHWGKKNIKTTNKILRETAGISHVPQHKGLGYPDLTTIWVPFTLTVPYMIRRLLSGSTIEFFFFLDTRSGKFNIQWDKHVSFIFIPQGLLAFKLQMTSISVYLTALVI